MSTEFNQFSALTAVNKGLLTKLDLSNENLKELTPTQWQDFGRALTQSPMLTKISVWNNKLDTLRGVCFKAITQPSVTRKHGE